MEKVRRHIYFSGRVQGVGFRWRSRHAAEAYGLTGWVDNLWDGRVEMEVQGNEQNIYDLISLLDSDMFIRIDDVQMREIPLRDDEFYFRVK